MLRKDLGMLYGLKIRIVSVGVAGIPIEQLAAAESEVTATKYLGKTIQCTDAWDGNETMTVHQLFAAITLRLMSPYIPAPLLRLANRRSPSRALKTSRKKHRA